MAGNFSGISISGRVIVRNSSDTPSGIQLTFSEFDPSALNPGMAIQDQSGSFNIPIGFTMVNGAAGFIDGGGSGVAMTNLTPENFAAFEANPNNAGYIWNVTWAAGSTYPTTPVAMYAGMFGDFSVIFWILDPADNTYSTPMNSGTFNYPAYFTSTTTPTTFQN